MKPTISSAVWLQARTCLEQHWACCRRQSLQLEMTTTIKQLSTKWEEKGVFIEDNRIRIEIKLINWITNLIIYYICLLSLCSFSTLSTHLLGILVLEYLILLHSLTLYTDFSYSFYSFHSVFECLSAWFYLIFKPF